MTSTRDLLSPGGRRPVHSSPDCGLALLVPCQWLPEATSSQRRRPNEPQHSACQLQALPQSQKLTSHLLKSGTNPMWPLSSPNSQFPPACRTPRPNLASIRDCLVLVTNCSPFYSRRDCGPQKHGSVLCVLVFSGAPPHKRSDTQQGFQQVLADLWPVSQLEMELRPQVDPQQCCAMVLTAAFKALPAWLDPCPIFTPPPIIPFLPGSATVPPRAHCTLVGPLPYLEYSSPRNPWGSPPCLVRFLLKDHLLAEAFPQGRGHPSSPLLCPSPLFQL